MENSVSDFNGFLNFTSSGAVDSPVVSTFGVGVAAAAAAAPNRLASISNFFRVGNSIEVRRLTVVAQVLIFNCDSSRVVVVVTATVTEGIAPVVAAVVFVNVVVATGSDTTVGIGSILTRSLMDPLSLAQFSVTQKDRMTLSVD